MFTLIVTLLWFVCRIFPTVIWVVFLGYAIYRDAHYFWKLFHGG